VEKNKKMNDERIIYSLLDTDLYKLTMMQAVYHQFPGAQAKYKFYCRNKANWTYDEVTQVIDEVGKFCELRFTEEELEYLSSLPFFKKDFIDFLRLYQPDGTHVDIYENPIGQLQIEIEGPWLLTIPFEVPILAIVNELYFNKDEKGYADKINSARKKLEWKYNMAKIFGFKFADFGTRRRFSLWWHRQVVERLMSVPGFVGTSNVMLAREYGLKPIGTMAHEWIMAGAGMPVQLENSQAYMLQKWADEYRGDLGIALTDTYGADKFREDFDLYFAKLYDGIRHDSGDPIKWAYEMIDHYKKLGIDPKNKSLIFSDGLTIGTTKKIYEELKDETNVSFGIGTHLTNDFDHEPLNIVIKMTECNGKSTAKLSDESGKEMCEDKNFLTYLKSVMGK
jgi:nicotinate phosphoribosyltransferase